MVKYNTSLDVEGGGLFPEARDAETTPDGFHSQRNRLFALFVLLVFSFTLWISVPNLFFLSQSSSSQEFPFDASMADAKANTTLQKSASGAKSGKVITAYFPAWSIYGRNYGVDQIDVTKLTHIHYAFANLQEDGKVVRGDAWADTDKGSPGLGNNLHGNLGALALVKRTHRHVKVSLSIGGWTWSTHFSAVAADPGKRRLFVASALAMVKDMALDGIDIDWEYPKNAQDANNYVLLLRDLRAALDAYAQATNDKDDHYLLSAALPVGEDKYSLLRLNDMDKYLDLFYIMCYDMSGAWESVAGHQANLYGGKLSCDKAIKYYINAGVTKKKIVMGLPMYGRAFENTGGIGQAFNGVGPGSWEAGIYDYKALPLPGAKVHTDHSAGASYSYDESKRMFVSYDTVDVIKKKCKYVQDNDIGGVMFWELSADRKDGSSLLRTAFDALGGNSGLNRSNNIVRFPTSRFDNIRAGK